MFGLDSIDRHTHHAHRTIVLWSAPRDAMLESELHRHDARRTCGDPEELHELSKVLELLDGGAEPVPVGLRELGELGEPVGLSSHRCHASSWRLSDQRPPHQITMRRRQEKRVMRASGQVFHGA